MTETLDHLQRLYAHSDDPWNFTHSPYEQAKFDATRRALSRDRYASALEIGCGNGALARHLAPLCARYAGIDAIERAVAAARRTVPEAEFSVGLYPCPLPGTGFDLVILSEILYFLTPAIIAHLARDLETVAPGAEILCITWLGDTEQTLQGEDALGLFTQAIGPRAEFVPVVNTGTYRIDRALPDPGGR